MITFNKSVYYKLLCRTCLSCLKKGMFLNVEGPLLHPWKASVLFERSENSWQGVMELRSEGDFFLTEEHRWTEHTGFLLSHRFTQMNRTHSIPQRPCGRQISQNLTAIFSWNALWSLYADGLLWARNVCQKGSVRSVSSVRAKNLYEVCKQPSRGNLAYYAPPCGGGVGGGATILRARNVC